MSETSESKPVQDAVEAAIADAQASVDELKDQAAAASDPGDGADANETADGTESTDDPARIDMPEVGSGESLGAQSGIELLSDVDLHVAIELGRTEMLVEDVLRLGPGSVVELDKLAGDPVDVFVNHRLVARGEVLVLNDNFCIRISEIVADLEEHALAAAEQHAQAAAG